jgi:hypothetical protein
MSSREESIAWL